jgi:hypothetical protein
MNTQRLVAVLNLSSTALGVLETGDATYAKVIASAALSACTTPTPAAFKTDLDALRGAQAVKGTGKPATAARNAALKQVKRDMENLRIFTQQLADANEAQAAQIIASAGMSVKKVAVRNKPDLAIVQGATTGSAIARAKSRGRGATYWWEYSTDQKTWTNAPVTRVAKTSFANLTPGTLYSFRFQTLTKAGLSDWSQIVGFMVK